MKQSLSDAIDDYNSFRRSTDISKRTIASDVTVLRRFLSVNGNVWVHQINERHVVRHFEVSARSRAASSLAVDHKVLRGFFAWSRQTKRMGTDMDPMYGRRKPKATQRERLRVHVSQFAAMLDAAEAQDPRNRMAVAMGLYTLARDTEIREVRLRDVDLAAGYVTLGVTKSHLEDAMPICAELDAELRTWLTYYSREAGPLEPHHFLLPARTCTPVRGDDGKVMRMEYESYDPNMRAGVMSRWIHEVLETLGVDDSGEGAHTLRRSGARALFDSLVEGGYDHALRIVQAMLHHSSMSTTEHYIGLSADKRSRDQIIRGKRMYALDTENVISLAR